ncbi:MAG TPA: TPM domain-containing protein [Paracoccaceae bacterium]|nr:TPM domain-containing protein [Paracoccaceae bacterium]
MVGAMARAGLAALVLWLAPAPAVAQRIPQPLSDTVSDYTGTLDPMTADRLSDALAAGRADTGVHVVLAVIDRRSDHGGGGERIDAFATRWFNAWGIGDATRNDGVLILVAQGDREMRIALGAGYSPVWDNRAQRVIDSIMLPAFRQGQMETGIEAGVMATIDLIARPFAEGRPVSDTEGFPAPDTGFDWTLLLFLGTFASLMAFKFRRGLADGLLILRRCPSCRARGLDRRSETLREAGETTRGEAREDIMCPACGHRSRSRILPIPSAAEARKAASSSSGGFGGGRSSGGGASGRW